MSDDIPSEELRLEKLSERHRDILATFYAKDSDFRDFLIDDALKQQEDTISTTYLFFYNPENKLVGYITLLADRVNINGTDLEPLFEKKGVDFKPLPALKIGKLCVHKDYEGRKVGSEMIFFAMKQLVDFSNRAGFRFLIVNAKATAKGFYERLNFKILKPVAGETQPMYFDMIKTIRYKRQKEEEAEKLVLT